MRRFRAIGAAAISCLAAACGSSAKAPPPSVSVASPVPTPVTIGAPTIAAAPATSGSPDEPHLFYTSADPSARFYFCRTDPLWRRIPKTLLRGFDSASTLQTAFPGRLLHQRC